MLFHIGWIIMGSCMAEKSDR